MKWFTSKKTTTTKTTTKTVHLASVAQKGIECTITHKVEYTIIHTRGFVVETDNNQIEVLTKSGSIKAIQRNTIKAISK